MSLSRTLRVLSRVVAVPAWFFLTASSIDKWKNLDYIIKRGPRV